MNRVSLLIIRTNCFAHQNCICMNTLSSQIKKVNINDVSVFSGFISIYVVFEVFWS
jgi:hypothetical protein